MSKVSYSDVARSTKGKALAAASVSVFEAGTTTLATIYSDVDGTVAANPLTAGSDGLFQFFVDPGLYKYTVSKAQFDDFTIDNVSIGVAAGYLSFVGTTSIGGGNSAYFGPRAGGATEAVVAGLIPRDGTLVRLRALVGGTVGSGESYTFTLRTGPYQSLVDTSLVATVSGDTDPSGADDSNSVSVTAGHAWAVHCETSAGSTPRSLLQGLIQLIPR